VVNELMMVERMHTNPNACMNCVMLYSMLWHVATCGTITRVLFFH
jgi:hypothetical protein